MRAPLRYFLPSSNPDILPASVSPSYVRSSTHGTVGTTDFVFIEMKTRDLLSYKTSSPQNSRKLSVLGLVGPTD